MPRMEITRIAIASLFLTCLLAPSLEAEMCSLDVVPAATLLLPYFEVDLEDPNGVNTLFSINNATTEPTIVHTTFWTNYSQPTLDFDTYLTGYDVQVVSLRNVFEGFLPRTADEQTDPGDTISPHGANPEWDGSFTAPPDCANFFPFNNPVIPAQNLERLINGHVGHPISTVGGGNCTGANLGDNIARGFITMDVARRCSIEFPSDRGYFGLADPVAIDDNRIWGDFEIRNPALGSAARDTLVHIEADPSFDGTTTSSGYTFYGRYSGGLDHREPLSSQWGARYYDGGDGLDTDLIVWRDSTASDWPIAGWECGTETPDWYPLEEMSVLCFDEEENFVELCSGPGEACFPLETQRVRVGGPELPVAFLSGWCQLNLNHDDDFADDVDFPVEGSPVAQSYVAVLHDQAGTFTSASRAVSLGSACDLPLGFTNIFADDFEGGDTGLWSLTQP